MGYDTSAMGLGDTASIDENDDVKVSEKVDV